MRILWINHRDPTHPEAGGAEVHLREVGKRLVTRGSEVTLLCERFPGSRREDLLDGMKIDRLGGRFDIHFRTPVRIARVAREYDVVVDDIAHAVPWWSGLFTRRPVVGLIHHVHLDVTRVELSVPLAFATRMAERTTKFAYSRIITVSEASRQQIETKLGVEPSRIIVIRHGVDHKRFRPADEKFERPTMLWLGRIKRYKKIEDLLQAFSIAKKAVPSLRLIIAGDGDHRPTLEYEAKQRNLHDVIFPGRISAEEKTQLLQRSWALCLTSATEGWGLVLTEAAACGLPAIAYNSGAACEAVINDQSGFLVEPGDVNSLADRIGRIASDRGLRLSLSKGALDYSRNFDWEKTVDQTLRVLSDAVNN